MYKKKFFLYKLVVTEVPYLCKKYKVMKNIKTDNILLCVLLGVAGMITSCQNEHSVYNPDNIQHTSELKIPNGFDWATTRSVSFTISSPVATTALLYLDKACTADQLIASVPVSAESMNLVLDIPTTNQELYVRYPLQDGKNEVMTVALPVVKSRAAENVVIKLPENAYTVLSEKGKLLSCLNKGTVMFEDNWPNKGDYDFNDFVMGYDIVTDVYMGTDLSEGEGVTVSVQFRAIGGNLGYRPGLQLDKILAKYIDKTDLPITVGGITVDLQNPGADEPAVFVFEGTNTLKGTDKSQFYNTEAENIVPASKMVTVTFHLDICSYKSLEKSQALLATAQSATHNFFLQLDKNGGKEIHLRGYNPSSLYGNYTKDAEGLMNPQIPYYSNDGFVWGVKVPANGSHAQETIDVISAYPRFREWVTSGGLVNGNWFKYPELDKIIQ